MPEVYKISYLEMFCEEKNPVKIDLESAGGHESHDVNIYKYLSVTAALTLSTHLNCGLCTANLRIFLSVNVSIC